MGVMLLSEDDLWLEYPMRYRFELSNVCLQDKHIVVQNKIY